MLRLIARRLAWSVPLLLVASLVSFVFVGLLPGDAARALLGANATAEQLAQARRSSGSTSRCGPSTATGCHALRGDLGRR